MDVEQVTAIYEFAAGMMPNEGHWNKPKTAPQLVAHHLVLKEVPYEPACVAVWYILVDEMKWPTPTMIRKRTNEMCPNWETESFMFHRGEEVEKARGYVEQVAVVAAQNKIGGVALPPPAPVQLESSVTS
jgi:hypothetical protein